MTEPYKLSDFPYFDEAGRYPYRYESLGSGPLPPDLAKARIADQERIKELWADLKTRLAETALSGVET